MFSAWGPKTLLFFGQKALPEKSGHTAKYVFLRLFFNIVSTTYGFYTAKYGQLWQMTETKNNLSDKHMPHMPFDRKKVAFRGSRWCTRKERKAKERKGLVFRRYHKSKLIAGTGASFEFETHPSPINTSKLSDCEPS